MRGPLHPPCTRLDRHGRLRCAALGVTVEPHTAEAFELGLESEARARSLCGRRAVGLHHSLPRQAVITCALVLWSAVPVWGTLAIAGVGVAMVDHSIGILGLALVVLSLVLLNAIHEIGHLAAARVVTRAHREAHLVVNMGFARIVRSETTCGGEIAISLAGPLAAAVTAVGLAALVPNPLAAIACAGAGIGHVVALLLPGGDGANLRDAVGRRRPARHGTDAR